MKYCSCLLVHCSVTGSTRCMQPLIKTVIRLDDADDDVNDGSTRVSPFCFHGCTVYLLNSLHVIISSFFLTYIFVYTEGPFSVSMICIMVYISL